MKQLIDLASLISLGISLSSLFEKKNHIDVEKLVETIVKRVEEVIHRKITENNFLKAKASADSLAQGIKNKYIEESKIKKKDIENEKDPEKKQEKQKKYNDELLKILKDFKVTGISTDSPKGHCNILRRITKQPHTTTSQMFEALTIYMLLSLLIISVLQEIARLNKSNSLQYKVELKKIKKYASDFKGFQHEIFEQTLNRRINQLSFQRHLNIRALGAHASFSFTDPFFYSNVCFSYDIRVPGPDDNLGDNVGRLEGSFQEFVYRIRDTISRFQDTGSLIEILGDRYFPRIICGFRGEGHADIKYFRGSQENLIKEYQSFIEWRQSFDKAQDTFSKLQTHPIGKPIS